MVGAEGHLRAAAEAVITTKPHFAYTLKEVRHDVARVFGTGWFHSVSPDAVDTRDGVKLVLKVRSDERRQPA